MPSQDWISVYTRFVVRWRWAIVVATFAAVAVVASGVRFLGFETSYRIFFSEDNPHYRAYEDIQEIYVKDDYQVVGIIPESGDVFTPRILGMVHDLTEEAWTLPYVTRVDSVTNFQNTRAEGDDLFVGDLVPDPDTLDAAEIARVREIALSEPALEGRLVARDGGATGLSLKFNFPEDRPGQEAEVVNAAEEMFARYEALYPDVRFAHAGSISLNHAFVTASQRDVQTLVPAMYGVLTLVMLVLLRSVSGTVVTVLVIGFSVLTAMGLTGWAGANLNPIVVMAPTIILTIGIADSIHILVIFLRELRHGRDRFAAIEETLRSNMQPVFLTSLTTIVGFLSLNTSDVPPFRELGNVTAVGVAAAWLFSITFLPAAMAILPFRSTRRGGEFDFGMAATAGFVIRNRTRLLVGVGLLAVLSASQIPRNVLDDRFVEYFDTSIRFRRDADLINEKLTGVYQLQYSIGSGEPSGINDPRYLRNLDRFANWLEEQPGVLHVATFSDVMKRLNRNMHGDDPAYHRLPEERELAAQYLLLYEMSLPFGLDLNDQIDVEKSATRLIATTANVPSSRIRGLKAESEAWLRANTPPPMHSVATHTSVMFSFISIRNVQSMIEGTSIAIVLIALTLMIALRSVKFGLVSLVPNLLPAVFAYGIWAVLNGNLGMAAGPVIPVSLGIVVDCTVHFLSKYLRARRDRGYGTEDAVRYAFSSVGAALLVTSAILVGGFSVLALSTFAVNEVLGLLTAITIAMALFADFLLLPPLLIAIDKERTDASEAVEAVPSP